MNKMKCGCIVYEPGCVIDQCQACREKTLLQYADKLENQAQTLQYEATKVRKAVEIR